MGRTKKEHREAAAARRKRLARPAKAPDPSQNLHVERGAPVTLGEVRAYALEGHPECRSRPGLGRDGRPCKCATRRFFAKHPEVIVDASGNAWWPASVKVVKENVLLPCSKCGAEWTVFEGGEDAGLVHKPDCPDAAR
jgi:hypothetical protein